MSVVEGGEVAGSVVSLFVLERAPTVCLCSRYYPGAGIAPPRVLEVRSPKP